MAYAHCWQRPDVEFGDDTVAAIADLNKKCHGILEAGIGAVSRDGEGRRQLTLLAYHLEKIANCIKSELATTD